MKTNARPHSLGLPAVALALAGCAGELPSHVLWQVDGATNTVFLLGSVHVLRESDYPLPDSFDAAYDQAERLVMELDMDDLDPVATRKTMLQAGLIDDGTNLQAWLGEQAWHEARAGAATLDLDLAMLQAAEPWFAALTIIEQQMTRLGYNPALGVEMHFLARASRDAKPIDGLETVAQQVAFFDQMPRNTQRRFLLKTIEDARELQTALGTLIEAWSDGDVNRLEAELLDSFAGFPDVYRTLVVARNARWAERIAALLDDDEDYLVVVGALHLIGKDSLTQLLAQRGYRIRPF